MNAIVAGRSIRASFACFSSLPEVMHPSFQCIGIPYMLCA